MSFSSSSQPPKFIESLKCKEGKSVSEYFSKSNSSIYNLGKGSWRKMAYLAGKNIVNNLLGRFPDSAELYGGAVRDLILNQSILDAKVREKHTLSYDLAVSMISKQDMDKPLYLNYGDIRVVQADQISKNLKAPYLSSSELEDCCIIPVDWDIRFSSFKYRNEAFHYLKSENSDLASTCYCNKSNHYPSSFSVLRVRIPVHSVKNWNQISAKVLVSVDLDLVCLNDSSSELPNYAIKCPIHPIVATSQHSSSSSSSSSSSFCNAAKASKRYMSAYMFFAQDHRPKFQKEFQSYPENEGSKLTFTEMGKLLAEAWLAIKDTDNAKIYIEKAAEDRLIWQKKHDEILLLRSQNSNSNAEPVLDFDVNSLGVRGGLDDLVRRVKLHEMARRFYQKKDTDLPAPDIINGIIRQIVAKKFSFQPRFENGNWKKYGYRFAKLLHRGWRCPYDIPEFICTRQTVMEKFNSKSENKEKSFDMTDYQFCYKCKSDEEENPKSNPILLIQSSDKLYDATHPIHSVHLGCYFAAKYPMQKKHGMNQAFMQQCDEVKDQTENENSEEEEEDSEESKDEHEEEDQKKKDQHIKVDQEEMKSSNIISDASDNMILTTQTKTEIKNESSSIICSSSSSSLSPPDLEMSSSVSLESNGAMVVTNDNFYMV